MRFTSSINMVNSLISQLLILVLCFSGSLAYCIDDHGNVGEIHPQFADCSTHTCDSSEHSCTTSHCEHNSCSDQIITTIHTPRLRNYVLTCTILNRFYNTSDSYIDSSIIKKYVSFDSPQKYLHKQHLLVLRI